MCVLIMCRWMSSQFQAITWGILSLLGILTYTGDITPQEPMTASNQFQWVFFEMYFHPNGKCRALYNYK